MKVKLGDLASWTAIDVVSPLLPRVLCEASANQKAVMMVRNHKAALDHPIYTQIASNCNPTSKHHRNLTLVLS